MSDAGSPEPRELDKTPIHKKLVFPERRTIRVPRDVDFPNQLAIFHEHELEPVVEIIEEENARG